MARKQLIGAHMSIAGGFHCALEQGVKAGCRTIQIFLKNSSQWRGKRLTMEDRDRYARRQEESGISPVMAHCSYLINLASPEPALYERSTAAFMEEMERANFLGVPYLILHPGAHRGAGEAIGIARVVAALNRALETVSPPVMILVENTAGQGSCIGHSFEHLAQIQDGVRAPERVGFCLDTCHLFAAGYDIRTESGYRRSMRVFGRLIGLDRIQAFHVNDSKTELGGRVDRHAHIGKGFIGLEAFSSLINDRRFAAVPKILETPKGPDLKEDIMNLAVLRSLYRGGRTI
jgi:deoxyribonuclease-4